jgi:DNA repair photolyase
MLTSNLDSEVPSNIIISEGRFFINITHHGCGNGCSFCYISQPKKEQHLINLDDLKISLDYVQNHSNFQKGRNGTLISLCPDTEPFKTECSTNCIAIILEHFLLLGNPIQISTKEVIPQEILELIQKNIKYIGQIVIFTSNSSISQSSRIEPYKRFENFIRCRDFGILSCMYIKPFLDLTINDLELYVDAIIKYSPDIVCTGIEYKKETKDSTKILFNHPAYKNLKCNDLSENLIVFRERVSKTISNPVFFSSICVSAFARDYFPTPFIWKDLPKLCVKCRDCQKDYDNSYI